MDNSVNPNHMIIGMGEIGEGLQAVIGPCLTFDKQDRVGGLETSRIVPILHITFPYSNTFIKDVIDYKKKYKAEIVVIYSTVPVGTTKQLGEGFVHSPIEGRHPYLSRSIRMAPRWLGSTDQSSLKKIATYWARLVQTVRMVPDSDFTEFLKLRSTSRYGINIAFARYEKKVADEIGMDWNHLMDFDKDYNQLYRDLGYPDLQRYVLTAPEGPIGGHCIVPNAEILNAQYPSKLLGEIK